jgi:hypothetical protein
VGCAVAIAAPSLANAATTQQAKTIHTTQRITTLSSTAQGAKNVGTSDGKIAGATVHGALRAVATFTTPSTFTATGTLFYPAGTLRYTLHGTATKKPDGSLTVSGSGKLTHGTGRYTGAHGRFVFSGTKPADSYETWTLKGKVSY